jgi:hypothetical protein
MEGLEIITPPSKSCPKNPFGLQAIPSIGDNNNLELGF